MKTCSFCDALIDDRVSDFKYGRCPDCPEKSDAKPTMALLKKVSEYVKRVGVKLNKTGKQNQGEKMSSNKTMQKYIGTKIIKAYPMNRKDYNDYRGWEAPSDEDPADKGYLVEYMDSQNPNHPHHDGYISWSPKETFENAYRPTDGMPFGLAIEALKKGKRVARAGWNGKNMFLFLLPASDNIPTEYIKDPALKKVIETETGKNTFDAYGSIRMWTAGKKILTGWLASQTDMLADDWHIVE